jgi:hypothetical protein
VQCAVDWGLEKGQEKNELKDIDFSTLFIDLAMALLILSLLIQNNQSIYDSPKISQPILSPLLINSHHIIKLAVHNAIIVQKQSFSLVITSGQKSTRSLLPL